MKKVPGARFALQDVEDLGGPLRIGTVVEGEREFLAAIPGPLDDIGRGQSCEIDPGDRAVARGDRIAHPVDRLRADLQDLARAFDVDIGAGGDVVDRVGHRELAVIAPEDRPQPRILGPQPPQRYAADPGTLEELHLVIGRRGVEQPDDMAAVAFLIGEARIAAFGVEARDRPRIRRRLPRLLDIERIAAAVVPVIGIGSDRDDQLGGRNAACRVSHRSCEPALRCDRPRLAPGFVLVIRHQEDLVGHPGIGGQVPIGVADRRRDRDRPTAPCKPRAGFGEELAIGGVRGERQILEIIEHARRMICDEEGHQLVEERLARRRVREQRRRPLAVPYPADRVLHHRQDRGFVDRLVDNRTARGVAEHGGVMIGAGHRNPAGNQPIELLDMPFQARSARYVPRRVEGDRERRVHRDRLPLDHAFAEQPFLVIIDPAPRAPDDPAGRRGQLAHRRMFGLDRQQRRHRHRADRYRKDRDREHQQRDERDDAEREAPPAATAGVVEDGL